ncbi:MAG: 2-oxoacid:ferredoxin oxidoreductase subunit beta [Dehalococcoidia bacterium]|nr:2-oxoacid:ferredoxin oxidoreductase subunit beta [Dehalococcoidia bacterium]
MMSRAERYLKTEKLPHIWCAGCGHGTALNALLVAFDQVQIDQNRTVVVSGIGCASRAVLYLNFNTMHTTHGRALAFATGIKLARPELTVVVLMGDGDACGIGGNHFIHSARRNIDLTAIILNNSIYGMTGGQLSPTTPIGSNTSTSPYGNLMRPFDICNLATAAGATYVARSTTYNVAQLARYCQKAISHSGFSVIDVISQCPTTFGRRNNMSDPVDMVEWERDNAISVAKARQLLPEELEGKIVVGEFVTGQTNNNSKGNGTNDT